MSNASVSLGKKLKGLREARGLSQEQVAEIVDVSPGSVSQWESGLTAPRRKKLQALADLFGVTIIELLGPGEPAPRPMRDPTPEEIGEVFLKGLDLSPLKKAALLALIRGTDTEVKTATDVLGGIFPALKPSAKDNKSAV